MASTRCGVTLAAVLVAAMASLALVPGAQSSPNYYGGCVLPNLDTQYGYHSGHAVDEAMTFELVGADGLPTSTYVAGATYTVKVTSSLNKPKVMLLTSAGMFPDNLQCNGMRVDWLYAGASEKSAEWVAPDEDSVVFQANFANSSVSPFKQGSAQFMRA